MPPKSNVPIRICGSKTRSGCRTCKSRHVKCDEGRPTCSRCQRADRQCFYDQPQLSQQIKATGQEGTVTLSTASQYRNILDLARPSGGLSPYGSHDTVEVIAIKNFTTYLGRELAGSFSDHVWCQVFPRMAQHEPSIWHAIVATSMLDTSIRRDNEYGDAGSSINKAVQHYTKAIQELSVRLTSVENTYSKDVVLVSCLLFAVFECLRSHFMSALRHVVGGMKLLTEWGHELESSNRGTTNLYLDHASLRPIFLSLDAQAIQMGAVGFQEDFLQPALSSQLPIPESFTTTEEPHLVLNQIFNRFSHWAQWVGPSAASHNKPDDDWMLAERHRLVSQFNAWDRAFDASSDILHSQPATLLVRIQRKVLNAFFNKQADGDSEMGWDNYLPLFKEAVELAELYTELTADHSGRSNNFTVAMDIVLSLFVLSVRCRDSGLRRRALKMLKTCDLKEGVWDSHLCAQIAESIIELEESGAQEDGFIPESARIYELNVSLGEETHGVINYKKLIPLEDGTYAIEMFEVLSV